MKRNRFLTPTIFCLITLLLIVQVVDANNIIIPLFDNEFSPPQWNITMVANSPGGNQHAHINADLLKISTGKTLTEPQLLSDAIMAGVQWETGTLFPALDGLLGLSTDEIHNSLHNWNFAEDPFEFGNINESLNVLGLVEGDIDNKTVYARMNITNDYGEEISASVYVITHGNTAAKVWLNGTLHIHVVSDGQNLSGDAESITFQPGDNNLVFKSSHGTGEWDVIPYFIIDSAYLGNIDLGATSAGNSLKKNQEFVLTNPTTGKADPQLSHFQSLGWDFREDFFTDIAVTENATYFVWKPSTPESFSNNFGYKSEMTLKIPGTITDEETALGLQRAGNLPSKYPYIMVPLPTSTPTEDANEAGETFTWWKASKIFWDTAVDALIGVSIDAGIDAIETLSPLLGKMKLSLWYTAGMVIYDTVVGSLALHKAENVAYDSITTALRNPSFTVENHSQFVSVGIPILDATSEARFLVMIPEPLESLSLDMETYYYEKRVVVGEGPTRIAMRWDPADGKVGDMHLFFDENNGRIYLNVPEKITTDPGFSDRDSDIYFDPYKDGLSELFGFWAHATDPDADYWKGYADKWLGDWADNKDSISEETKEALHSWFSQTHEVWAKLALGSIPVKDVFENAKNPAEDALLNWFGIYFDKPMIHMLLPQYDALPEDPLVTSHTFQLQWAAAAAPHARSMSLADYPPFQELAPEIQALLLDYSGETTRRKGIELNQNPIPEQTSLLPNYPNPFNPETWIPYQLAQPAEVTLTIYDINGHNVRRLDLGHQRAGMYHSRSRAAYWDGRNEIGESVASGVYFYTLTAGEFSATRKLLIRK